MKKYAVRTKCTFYVDIEVNAENKEEARKCIERSCGIVISDAVHTTLSDEKIPDWSYDTHPERKIVNIKRGSIT